MPPQTGSVISPIRLFLCPNLLPPQIDRRGLPLPSASAFSGTGGMLRGLLMRRQSSQVSNHGPSSSQPSLPFDDETSVVVSEPLLMQDIAFGDPSQDAGDEVRFSVELTRLDRLNDTFSLDIRRLKGNLRSYKFLYDTLRKYVGSAQYLFEGVFADFRTFFLQSCRSCSYTSLRHVNTPNSCLPNVHLIPHLLHHLTPDSFFPFPTFSRAA